MASELVEAAKTGFGRLGDFLHLFDLSYLVSGSLTFAGLVYLGYRLGVPDTWHFDGWLKVVAVVVGAYISGLLSLSIGRRINNAWLRKPILDEHVPKAIAQHHLLAHRPGAAINGSAHWHVYLRLWQIAVALYPNSGAVNHLMRYWAMAATCDGLAVSMVVWAVAVAPYDAQRSTGLDPGVAGTVFVALIALALQCFWQSAKYYQYQVEDMVAALAVLPLAEPTPTPKAS